MEHLRHVAAVRGADPAAVAEETVEALAHMCLDPAALVVTARRMVERQPTAAQLWWACARVLTAVDPCAETRHVARLLRDDDTFGCLDEALGSPVEGDRVPVFASAWAVGPDAILTTPEEALDVDDAGSEGRDVWCIATRGTRLPGPLWGAVVSAVRDAPRTSRGAVPVIVPRSAFTRIACADGVDHADDRSHLWIPECAHAPELLRRGAI